MATVFEPNLLSLARLQSRRHFSSTVVSVCTYVISRVNSRTSALWFVLTSASRVVRHSAILVAGQSGRSLHTGSRILICQGVGQRRWGGYRGYTLPFSKKAWGPISTAPLGFGMSWEHSPDKACTSTCLLPRIPFPITLISCRWRRGGYRCGRNLRLSSAWNILKTFLYGTPGPI